MPYIIFVVGRNISPTIRTNGILLVRFSPYVGLEKKILDRSLADDTFPHTWGLKRAAMPFFHFRFTASPPSLSLSRWSAIHFLDTFPLTFSIIALYRPTDRGTSSFFLALVPPAHSEQRLTTTARKKQIKVVYTICSLGGVAFRSLLTHKPYTTTVSRYSTRYSISPGNHGKVITPQAFSCIPRSGNPVPLKNSTLRQKLNGIANFQFYV